MLDLIECPTCDTPFTPKRKNQKYCERACQKNSNQSVTRGSRTIENGERNRVHFERTQRLAEMIYSVKPSERLGVMKEILSYIPVDAGLRNILTNHTLLKERPTVDGRMNIAKAANGYVRKFFGVSISTYVRKIKAGEEVEGIEVAALLRPVLVPKLSKSLTPLKVKCWHKPLASGPEEVIQALREAAQATPEADPDLADSINLRADVRQANTTTDEDRRMIDAIVNQSSQARAA